MNEVEFQSVFEDGELEKLVLFGANKKTPITFWVKNEEIHSITIDNEHCFDSTEDALYDIFVSVGSCFYNLQELMIMAEGKIEGLIEEEAAEIAAAEDHRAYVSSPYLTGRI